MRHIQLVVPTFRKHKEFVRQKGVAPSVEFSQLVGVVGQLTTRDVTALVDEELFSRTGKGKSGLFALP